MVPGRFTALMYHNLAPRSMGRYSLAIDDFKAQLAWLRGEGYTMEGFRELQGRLARDDFPERYVVVTFDDGHKSNLVAARMLRDFDAQATFFITKDVCRSHPKFMSDDEIAEVSRLCSVGSHGVTHEPLSRMSPDRLLSELRESKRWLEAVAGRPVDTLSAPGGFLDSRVVRHALEAGYSLVGNSVEWWNDAARVARERIVNRVEVRASLGLPTFARIVRGEVTYLLRRRLRSALAAIPRRLSAPRGG